MISSLGYFVLDKQFDNSGKTPNVSFCVLWFCCRLQSTCLTYVISNPIGKWFSSVSEGCLTVAFLTHIINPDHNRQHMMRAWCTLQIKAWERVGWGKYLAHQVLFVENLCECVCVAYQILFVENLCMCVSYLSMKSFEIISPSWPEIEKPKLFPNIVCLII